MENEKELKGQEIPETQVEPTEELNSENLASQEETTKSDISEWDASEPVLDEPVVAKAEVSEGFVSEPVIAEPVIAASEPFDSKVEEKTSEQSAYADIPQNRSLENQDEIKTKWNWGAFSFPMWFGIANRAYLGLLILIGLIPWIGWIFGIVWMIVLVLMAKNGHLKIEIINIVMRKSSVRSWTVGIEQVSLHSLLELYYL